MKKIHQHNPIIYAENKFRQHTAEICQPLDTNIQSTQSLQQKNTECKLDAQQKATFFIEPV